MRRTNIPGHALRGEGKPYTRRNSDAPWEHIGNVHNRWHGVALCECGAVSGALDSDAARKRWHAGHKDEIRRDGVSGNGDA